MPRLKMSTPLPMLHVTWETNKDGATHYFTREETTYLGFPVVTWRSFRLADAELNGYLEQVHKNKDKLLDSVNGMTQEWVHFPMNTAPMKKAVTQFLRRMKGLTKQLGKAHAEQEFTPLKPHPG